MVRWFHLRRAAAAQWRWCCTLTCATCNDVECFCITDVALQAEAAVSCSAAEFKRAIAASGYRAQPDLKRVRMLQTISKVRVHMV
jgi:hypothetical protein